jgi:flavin-dependent dehydrogenase
MHDLSSLIHRMNAGRNLRIAIVGAGPAGAAAGWHLATHGQAVTLIDAAAFPRDKTCGDWLTPAALAELALMGLDRALLGRLAPGHATVTATRLVAPSGHESTRSSVASGACIPRQLLDHLVRERAIAAGCAPVQRAIRTFAADADYLSRFDLVVDARGATVGRANAIGLRGYFTVPRAAVDRSAAQRVEIRTDSAFRRGYGWVFPVHADDATVRFNVGVGLWKSDSGAGHTVAHYFDRFLARDPAARVIAGASTHRERPVGYPVALGEWRARVAEGRVLRIGDAANLADPLTGDGIGNALASGRRVASVIAGSRDAHAAAQVWQRYCEQEFFPDLRWALVLRRLLTATAAKNVAARVLDIAPALGTRLHRAIFGEVGYRDAWRTGTRR